MGGSAAPSTTLSGASGRPRAARGTSGRRTCGETRHVAGVEVHRPRLWKHELRLVRDVVEPDKVSKLMHDQCFSARPTAPLSGSAFIFCASSSTVPVTKPPASDPNRRQCSQLRDLLTPPVHSPTMASGCVSHDGFTYRTSQRRPPPSPAHRCGASFGQLSASARPTPCTRRAAGQGRQRHPGSPDPP